MLDWNAPAIGFYEALGARPLDDWTVYRIDDEPLARLAGTRPCPPTSDARRRRMSRYFHPHIDRMAGYVPGEQPRDGGFIKLNTNENPYPPSPRVAEAIAQRLGERLRRYPDPLGTAFREAAARHHGVAPDMILAGNGSDDLLTIITRAFVGPGDASSAPTPSYILYRTLVELQDARLVEVPFRPTGRSTPTAFADRRREARLPGQPEQPVGHLPRRPTRSRALAERLDCPLVVDEAYADFAATDCVGLVARPPQRDRHPDLQQGLQPGRPPARLPDRPARDRRGADQGQGLVQLRHPQPGRRRRRARRPGLPRPRPAPGSSRPGAA